MTRFKIIIDREKCIGCGACAAVCDNFTIKKGKSFAKKEIVKEIGCNETAAAGCPVNAITMVEVQ